MWIDKPQPVSRKGNDGEYREYYEVAAMDAAIKDALADEEEKDRKRRHSHDREMARLIVGTLTDGFKEALVAHANIMAGKDNQ